MLQAKDQPLKSRIWVKQIKNPKKINKREVIAREENKMRNNKNYISKYMQKLKKKKTYSDNNGSQVHTTPAESKRKDEKYVYTSRSDFENVFQMSFNQVQNQQITQASVNLIRYFEKNLLVKIREIKLKFLFDKKGVMYFGGFKQMLCVLRTGKFWFLSLRGQGIPYLRPFLDSLFFKI